MTKELQKKYIYLAYFYFQHLSGISASVLDSLYLFNIHERTGFYFIFIGFAATRCNTEAALNGSPRF